MSQAKTNILAAAFAWLLVACSAPENPTAASKSHNEAAAVIAAQAEAIAKKKAEDRAKQAAALTRASQLYQGELPFGETGQGETVDLFMDVCVGRFTKDLYPSLKIAKDSGYEVLTERSSFVHHREADEKIPVIRAWTRSPATGQNNAECPIRLDFDYSSYGAVCRVRLDDACTHFDPEGVFLEEKLLESEYITQVKLKAGQTTGAPKKACEGTTVSTSDLLSKQFTVRHPTSEVNRARLKYMRCNARHVTLETFIPWMQE